VGQEVAGQDEERDRHDLELLDAGEQLERHRFEGTWVMVNRKVSTVRPSEIEIGMPVSIRTASRMPKMMSGVHFGPPCQVARGRAGDVRPRGFATIGV
jgi:hypothetical protein